MKKITKYIGMRTIKTAIGAATAILIAQLIGLDYGVNTAIVVILSLQNTKRKSLNLAGVRIASSVIALSIAWILFRVIGFNPVAFGLYLLFFIPIVVRFRLNEGLVPSSVLVTHLLASQSIAFSALVNEFSQMVIGATIALLLNLYIPGIERHLMDDLTSIKLLKFRILENMEGILKGESSALENPSMLKELGERIRITDQRVMSEAGENFNRGMDYYMKYLKMEYDHQDTMEYMERQVRILSESSLEGRTAVAFTTEALVQLKSQAVAKVEMDKLKAYIDNFIHAGQVSSREEFQNKAALFEYLTDLYRLLEIKASFIDSLSYADRKLFREMHEIIVADREEQKFVTKS